MQMDGFFKQHGYRVAPVTVDNGEWVWAFAYANVMNEQADSPARARRWRSCARATCRTC